MIDKDHPLRQVGDGLLAIWRNVHDLQSAEWSDSGGVAREIWTTELAAADAASMALGIHFAPYTQSFRRYLVEVVKNGIAQASGVEDHDLYDTAFASYLDAIARCAQRGEDADSGDVLASELRQRARTNVPGVERRVATRLGMLSRSAKDFVEAVGQELDEPEDLPPAFSAEPAAPKASEGQTQGGPTARASNSEKFFLERIVEGLSGAETLSAEERELLLTPVESLGEKAEYARAKGVALQAKCVRALETAYRNDTKYRKRAAAIEWREHNEDVYKYSRRVISPIVQEWYLAVGRGQEKEATGCFAMLLTVAAGAIALVWIGYAVARAG